MIMLGILAAQRVLAAFVNLIANGDFAQAGTGWTSYVVASAGSASVGTSNVTFNGGACQLLRTSAGIRGSNSGGIGRSLGAPPTRVSAVYRLGFDYSAPDTPASGGAILGGSVPFNNLTAASSRVVMEVTASADDVAEFRLQMQAASNGTAVTIDNVTVELITPAPADFNYVAEGDFANGQGQWFAGYEQDGSLIANSGQVSFNNGACQLRSYGDDSSVEDAVIGRNLKGSPGVGGTYRVSFDQSFPNGAVSTDGRYEVVLGGKSQAYAPKQGRVTVEVVAATINDNFRLFGSSYDGRPVTVDNISVTRV